MCIRDRGAGVSAVPRCPQYSPGGKLMSLPRPIIPSAQPVLPVRPDRAEVAEVFPESTPLAVDVKNMGNAPRLPAAEGDYKKRVTARTKAKAKSNESVKRRDLIPGHEIYLLSLIHISEPTRLLS